MHSFHLRCLSFFDPGVPIALYRDLEDLIFKLPPFFLRYFKTDGFDVLQQVVVLSRSRDRYDICFSKQPRERNLDRTHFMFTSKALDTAND